MKGITLGVGLGQNDSPSGGGPLPPFNTKSILFDGVDEYLSGGAPANLTGTTPATITFWFKTAATGTNNAIVANTFFGSAGFDYHIVMNSTGRIFSRFTSSGGVAQALGPGSWDDDAWHLGVACWDGSDVSIDIDGGAERVSVACADRVGGGVQFGIGTYLSPVGGIQGPLIGNLDEVAYWAVGFTAAQCIELYNGGTPTRLTTHSAAADLVSWWRMGDTSADSTDSSNPDARVRDVVGSNDVAPINMEGADIVLDVP